MALLYGVVAAGVALSGPGSASLDRALRLDDHWSVAIGLAAIAAGLLGGVAFIARARWILRHEAAATTPQTDSGAHATAA